MDHRTGEKGKMGRDYEKNAVRVIVIALLVALRFAPVPDVLSHPCVGAAFVHHFFHANILHLAVNCWSCWLLFRPEGRNASLKVLIAGYAIATLAYMVAIPFLSRAPIGFSNVLMAVCGLSVRHYAPGWWKRQWFISIVAVNVIMLMTPAVAALTHLLSFAGGLAIGSISGTMKKNKKDYERVAGNR